MAQFEIVQTRLGATSIKCLDVGEIMHNPLGPKKEPDELYIRQAGYYKMLMEPGVDPLLVYDVGFGAGANAICAARDYLLLAGPKRPLHIVSFEIDFSLIEFALENVTALDYLSDFESIIRILLKNGFYEDKENNFQWTLVRGDFTQTLREVKPPPELVFFEPYSPKMNAPMWAPKVFEDLYAKASKSARPSLMVTYSRATAVRAALLCAGFYVGSGSSLFGDIVPTLAATDIGLIANPLDGRWLTRWERSSAKWQNPNQDTQIIQTKLQNHPQFKRR